MGVRSEVEWSTPGSHLGVTTSLEEQSLSTGKDDPGFCHMSWSCFKPIFDNIKGPQWPLSCVTPHCCDVDTVELFQRMELEF